MVLLDGTTFRVLLFLVFVVSSLTDLFDGWLARRQGTTSLFGAWLDPIADKALALSVLLMLMATGELGGIHGLAVLVIVLREVLITGLRGYLALLPPIDEPTDGTTEASADSRPLATTRAAKWKAAAQLLAVAVLLAAAVVPQVSGLGLALLWLAAGLSLSTGWHYWQVARARLDATSAPR